MCASISHSEILHHTEPWKCFSGQRQRPKKPCCYHDNLGGVRGGEDVQNASLVFLTCPANLIISSMKAAPATSQRCYFLLFTECVAGETPPGQYELERWMFSEEMFVLNKYALLFKYLDRILYLPLSE